MVHGMVKDGLVSEKDSEQFLESFDKDRRDIDDLETRLFLYGRGIDGLRQVVSDSQTPQAVRRSISMIIDQQSGSNSGSYDESELYGGAAIYVKRIYKKKFNTKL